VAEQRTFDVVVIGGGAVGENAADRAARTGLDVALVEGALVGGECSYWACMPSKVLLRAGGAREAARHAPGVADPGDLDVAAALARRDEVTHRWDDAPQADWVASAGLTLVRGHARFVGERTLAVATDDGEVRVTARRAVIVATGSVPHLPPIDGLADARPWTSREATSAQHVPARLVVLGGGVVGCELATAFAELGSEVMLVARGSSLLTGAEPFAGEAVLDALRARGVRVLLDAQATAVHRDDDGVRVTVGDEVLTSDELLVATGRRPATDDLGLETVGLEPGRAIQVDDALAATGVAGGWLFAVGDVTGRTGTTHQGKYDARVAGDVVAARFGSDEDARAAEADAGPWSRYRATADHGAVPQVVFTHPEVAWVGRTEREARDAGADVRVVDHELSDLAGASVLAPDYRGRARLVLDPQDVVVGATFVGPDVAELLHAATVAVVAQVPLGRLWHAVPAYPTLSEVWLRFGEATGL